MAMKDSRLGAEEVRKRVQELRQEIDNLRKLDQGQRMSRESQCHGTRESNTRLELRAWMRSRKN